MADSDSNDDLSIPEFLKVSAEDRKAAWDRHVKEHGYTNSYHGGNDEKWRVREAERRAQIAADRKEKNARALARLKAEHEGEHYDRKLKMWVKNDG